ncbi:putative periplasmic solute-binding protein [Legionella lansingensis]|uniref:Endolytic murein transglycosylase n=1 Tax=Legionella lansingensis TaxID=45067 RepID=A0A0W0VRJ8_9GAMM|nr:endolytic transglycosylase MltG [Legionella lansingensis]KTD22310.1 periplasmic solute-binding protein [Legionella lansingensis]SNV50718.1 putative periplasmic solute-binding protein [Legionella lansingensis]
MSRLLKFIFLSGLALGLIGVSVISYITYSLYSKPMVTGEKPVIVTIHKNTSASAFVASLKAKQLIQSNRLFLSFIKLKGLAPHLRAGIYEVQPGESAMQFLNKVVAGKVLVESFSIIEGTTLVQVKANLSNARFLEHNIDDWQGIEGNHPSPEGLLLADTYYYNAGSQAKDLLKLANRNLLQYLDYCWRNRSPGLPYKSPYELLIAASILEKETSLPSERKLISGVVVNRLKKNMPLQMDPTVIYALGPNYHGKLTHEDLAVASSYNTYRYRGLPPTPIAMVGKEAIDAAAHPQPTDYLYFVSKGDGSHQFSVTYEEQKQAISQYRDKGAL